MRTFMLGTLIMTFLSGATSGYLVGNSTADATPTRTDLYIMQLQQDHPDITAEDLSAARKIYEDHELRLMELKAEAQNLLRDQLDWVENQSRKKMDAIIDKYRSNGSGSK